MIEKEKAERLCMDFIMKTHTDDIDYGINRQLAKQCALIAMDYILEILPKSEYLEDRGEYHENRELIYWKQVKQEIEKL